MTTEIGYRLSQIGIPEVDKVIQGSMFAGRMGEVIPDVDRICPKFQRQVVIESRKFQGRRTNSYNRSVLSKHNSTIKDRIGGLPDEILHFIISLLTMREGAATSILSTRWRDLWSTSVSCYNFDLSNMTGFDYLTNDNTDPKIRSRLRDDKKFLAYERKYFRRWVHRVLRPRPASKINALRISFVLGEESASYIDRWIKYAANQGLTELELDFELLYVGLCSRTAYEFPFRLFGSLKYLLLKGCNFNYPSDFKGFNSLVSLTLTSSFLTKDGLQNILSNCSFLEALSLLYCKFHGFLNNLKFSGPSLPLKHLRLHMTAPDNIMKIEVHDVNFVSIEFVGSNTKLSIKNTPHLARLVLCTRTPVDIMSTIPRLETLFFTAPLLRFKVCVLPKFYVFNNLKRLVFPADGNITDLLVAIDVLKACPLLQKLELDMGIRIGVPRNQSLTNTSTTHEAPHNNLKEVEIYGFQDYPEKILLIKYLLRNAIVLEKMKFFLYSKMYVGDGKWILREGTVKQTQMSLEKVLKLLQKEARPSTELILCPHN